MLKEGYLVLTRDLDFETISSCHLKSNLQEKAEHVGCAVGFFFVMGKLKTPVPLTQKDPWRPTKILSASNLRFFKCLLSLALYRGTLLT